MSNKKVENGFKNKLKEIVKKLQSNILFFKGEKK